MNKTIAENIVIQTSHNQIANNNRYNSVGVKPSSNAVSQRNNDKYDNSRQASEKNSKCSKPKQKSGKNNLNNRLNIQNYVSEIHNALKKEYERSLINITDQTLDFGTLARVTNTTLQAIKV